MKNGILKILFVTFVLITVALSFASCADTGNISRSESDGLISALDEMNAESNEYFIVSFPGLGAEPIVMNRYLGNLGTLTLTWSGVITAVAVIIAIIYAYFTLSKSGMSLSAFLDTVTFGLIGGGVGGRVFYLLGSFDTYKNRPFVDIFKFWDGGMAIFGALLGGAFALAGYCAVKKISIMKIYDAVVPALIAGQVIGRLGDFFNGSSYGLKVAEGSIFYSFRMGIYPNIITKSAFEYVHPVFLYESVWNLIGLIIISIAFFRKKNFHGQILFMYLAWYGFGRTFIEMIRADSLYIGSVRISLLLSCLSFFVGVALFVYGIIEGKKKRLETEEYESAYPLFKTKFASSETKDDSKK